MRLGKGTLALGLILFLSASFSARAQTTTGTLRGTVTDETGGSLPGGTVTATNDDTGFSRSVTTAASGFYNISLPPGPYTVVVTLPSFATITQKVRIQVGDIQTFDARMLLEARQQAAVTVSAEAPVIETKSNEVATNVTEEQIKQLPQDNRNFHRAPSSRRSPNPVGTRSRATRSANIRTSRSWRSTPAPRP